MSHQDDARRTLTRREFLKLGAGAGASAGAAWLLASCSPAPTPVPTQAPPTAAPAATSAPATAAPKLAETKKIVQGTYNNNWANNVLSELAQTKGWFKAEGIDDKEIVIIDQSQLFPAAIGGSLMVGQQDTDLIAGASMAGEKLVFVSCYRDKEPWIFAAGKGIKTAADLKGKTVSGGAIGTRNEANAKEMLRRLGLDPEKDVQWVPVSGGSDGRMKAVIGGVIAGTAVQDRHVKPIQDAGGVVLYSQREQVPQDAYFVHANWLKNNERTLIGFLKATFKARGYALDMKNKDEIIALMKSRNYDMPQDFIDIYQESLNIMSPTGNFDPKAMQTLLQASLKAGTIKSIPDLKGFINLDYQNQAFKELGRADLVMTF
jgi:ABC-type nitrate/sulfonate/bicarbonate transport system substrate-binding protein